MGVAAHLGIDLREYDARIRTFIPSYSEMLDAAASAVSLAGRSPRIVDLGIGTGALSERSLRVAPRARITGVDSDDAMLAVARRRLGPALTTICGDFTKLAITRADAITASFSLHHVPTRRRKTAVYARAFDALASGGVLISADCCWSSDPRLQRTDRQAWRAHLETSYSRAESERFLRAWSKEDVYFTLDDELAMLGAAGFAVDVRWRRGAFAVLVAVRRISGRRGSRSAGRGRAR